MAHYMRSTELSRERRAFREIDTNAIGLRTGHKNPSSPQKPPKRSVRTQTTEADQENAQWMIERNNAIMEKEMRQEALKHRLEAEEARARAEGQLASLRGEMERVSQRAKASERELDRANASVFALEQRVLRVTRELCNERATNLRSQIQGFVASSNAHREPTTCPICLDSFEDGALSALVACGHVMHTTCLKRVADETTRASCPVCRTPGEMRYIRIFL